MPTSPDSAGESLFHRLWPRVAAFIDLVRRSKQQKVFPLDDVKEKAMAIFDRFRAVARFRRISQLLVVFALISWSAGRLPAAMRATDACIIDFSDYLLNHHVVFLIGNAIIVLLLALRRRQSDDGFSGGDFCDDYVKFSTAAAACLPELALPSPSIAGEFGCGGEADREGEPAVSTELSFGSDDGEKQIVVRAEETKQISHCDDVADAIEKAKSLIQRFHRTQSEKLKREISVRTQPVFRRSETDGNWKTVSSRPTKMETLSNEEFRRKVDAFIDAHWSGRKGTKNMSFKLLKMS